MTVTPTTPVWSIVPDLPVLVPRQLSDHLTLASQAGYVPRPHYNWGNDRIGTLGLSGGVVDATGLIIGTNAATTAEFYAAGQGQTTGKWYFEAKCNSFAGLTTVAIGCHAGGSADAFTGTTTNSFIYTFSSNDTLVFNNVSTSSLLGTQVAAGEWLGFAVDLTNSKVWVRNVTKGGGFKTTGQPEANSGGVTISGFTGAWQPGARLTTSVLESNVVTFNFGATGFVGDVPQGFNTWPGLFTRDNLAMVSPDIRDIIGRWPQLPPGVATGVQTWYQGTNYSVVPNRVPPAPIYPQIKDIIGRQNPLPTVSTDGKTWYMGTNYSATPKRVPPAPIYPQIKDIIGRQPLPQGMTTQFWGTNYSKTPTTLGPPVPVVPDIRDIIGRPPPPPQGMTTQYWGTNYSQTPNTSITAVTVLAWGLIAVPPSLTTGPTDFTLFVPSSIVGTPSTAPPTPVFPDRVWQPTSVPQGMTTWYQATNYSQTPNTSITAVTAIAWGQILVPQATGAANCPFNPPLVVQTPNTSITAVSVVSWGAILTPQGFTTQYWATPQYVTAAPQSIFPERIWQRPLSPITYGPVDYTLFVPSSIVGTPSTAAPQAVFPDRIWTSPLSPVTPGNANDAMFIPSSIVGTPTTFTTGIFSDRVYQPTSVPQGMTTQYWATKQRVPTPTAVIYGILHQLWQDPQPPQGYITSTFGTVFRPVTPSTAPPQPVFPDIVWQNTQVPQGFVTQYWATPQFVPFGNRAVFPDRVWQEPQIPQGMTTQYWTTPQQVTLTKGIFPERIYQPAQVPQGFITQSLITPQQVTLTKAIFPDIVWQLTAVPQGYIATTFGGGIRPGTPTTVPSQPVFPDRVWQEPQVPQGMVTQYWATPQQVTSFTAAIFPDRVWQPSAVPQGMTTQYWATNYIQIPNRAPVQPVFSDRIWQPTSIPQGMTTWYQATNYSATPNRGPVLTSYPDFIWQPTAVPQGMTTEYWATNYSKTPTTFTAGIFPDRIWQPTSVPQGMTTQFWGTNYSKTPKTYVNPVTVVTIWGQTFVPKGSDAVNWTFVLPTALTPTSFTAGIFPDRIVRHTPTSPQGMTTFYQTTNFSKTPTTFTAGIFPERIWQPTVVPQGMTTFYQATNYSITPKTSITAVTALPWGALAPQSTGVFHLPYPIIAPPIIGSWESNEVEPDYLQDINGNLILDVDGNPIILSISSGDQWASSGVVQASIWASTDIDDTIDIEGIVAGATSHSGVQRIEWAIKRKIEWIIAKQIVERVYDRDLQWLQDVNFDHMMPSQRAALIDTIAQSIEMRYLVDRGMLLTDLYHMVDEIKKERQEIDDDEAISFLLGEDM